MNELLRSRPQVPEPTYREVCGACRRPVVVCYCRHVQKQTTRTRVVILQHPRERDVPINTARIASLCLPEAELHVGVEWGGKLRLGDPERPAALLYPGEGAIDIEANPPSRPVTLVVVDGTWWQAKKLVRANPEIAALPRYAFRPTAPSNYRIRREPQDDYVSTIEALVHVLGVLEGEPDKFLPMLVPFRAMVDAQIEHIGRCKSPRRVADHNRRPKRDPWNDLPAAFRERPRDLVCVYAEANAWPYDVRAKRPWTDGLDELIHWVAYRPSTGETFSAIAAPKGELSPTTPSHVGVSRETILNGMSTPELFERWNAFARKDDVFCGWGTFATDLFLVAGGPPPRDRIDLRRESKVFTKSSVGTMDAFRERLGIPQGPPLTEGRAGARLATLSALTSYFTKGPGSTAR